jgi:aminoglycoside/choline kinase family phosphotransferase
LLLKTNGFPESVTISELPSSGSNRKYFRLSFKQRNPILAAFNPDVSENIAWYSFTIHFREKNLPVPEIFAKDNSYQYFLLEDLGNTSLLQIVSQGIHAEVVDLYQKTLDELLRFQVEGIQGLDLDVAFPVREFDRKSILWDLNYFKYYFIKTHDLSFDENKLEADFQRFADVLLQADSNYFMYRDFQARNVMIKDGKPWFIDFQGGRQGPLQYDLVSMLYQAKANLAPRLREKLYTHYLSKLETILPGKVAEFKKHFPDFIFFRLMQVFGAYGFRGLIQRKGHFLASIPFAIDNLKSLLATYPFAQNYPELTRVFQQMIKLEQYQTQTGKSEKLIVTVNSFSFKKTSYPNDTSENGGGFVFDCRFLPNPGRIVDLRDFNGTQQPVIDYLDNSKEMSQFLENAFEVVRLAVENYIERGFSNLQVNFGCTGGKHRSVYSAERLCEFLKKYSNRVIVIKNHLQKNDW